MNPKRSVEEKSRIFHIVFAITAVVLILSVLGYYLFEQRKNVIDNAEQVANQMAENLAGSISNEIGYGESSIRLAAVTIAQTMTSDILEEPAQILNPMIADSPFSGIEYIRADGMNVMNIGEAFDASDRVYYIEGIQGHTGIWNNYHPKTSKETLINFYTPLVYDQDIVGVITGYIGATSQIAPLFETKLYEKEIYGLFVDENDMVICSTLQSEFVKDFTLDQFMDQSQYTDEQRAYMHRILANASSDAKAYKNPGDESRICVCTVPGRNWKVAIVVPDASFRGIVLDNTKNTILATVSISVILMIYAAYMLLRNAGKRRRIAEEKETLQEENLVIHDIMASAQMGTWRIELVDGKNPRMLVDDTMKSLLGIAGKEMSPEKVYEVWYANIAPEAVPSVLHSVDRMQQGFFDENTYLWMHPEKGLRFVRCGGTAIRIQDGFMLRGYHYDVDDVVREDQAKVDMLRQTLSEKNEYFETLGTLEGIFFSMHVLDLIEDTVIEYNTREEVKAFVNHQEGAAEMMRNVMAALTVDEYTREALEFTDLQTLPDRMIGKKIISKQFIGVHTGWFLASFITMESDAQGRATKVIYTTRVIDEEKKQEERLIQKSQTDEMTGLLNRRAYEEDIYAHNDTPTEDKFIYISLDVNGLKVINDTLGHTAGDELIVGACQCMKNSLGPYGKLYRIGGDEFVAIMFCNDLKLKDVLVDFDETIRNWSGKLVESLTISYGFVSKEEMPGYSVRQLGAIAEKRMYESKEAYYRRAGFDRRGQKDAHKALCDLYTKILKINITEDSYQIVNMDAAEQTAEKGFSDRISQWLKSFGETGQVHPDDLEAYLRQTDISYLQNYFAGDKTSLHIFYRRKYEDGFKQVMMEIIPTKDYREDSQTLFLYVKNIDK